MDNIEVTLIELYVYKLFQTIPDNLTLVADCSSKNDQLLKNNHKICITRNLS